MVCLTPNAFPSPSRSLGEYATLKGEMRPPALRGEATSGELRVGEDILGEYGLCGICNLFKERADSGPGVYGDIGTDVLTGRGRCRLSILANSAAQEVDRVRGLAGLEG